MVGLFGIHRDNDGTGAGCLNGKNKDAEEEHHPIDPGPCNRAQGMPDSRLWHDRIDVSIRGNHKNKIN
ncbi:hypothetical protein LBMAG25_16470 [Bacteroidota bacterium]|nr:hypothetical protein LBMAG25_16470 [Bacteroidota bacterium]